MKIEAILKLPAASFRRLTGAKPLQVHQTYIEMCAVLRAAETQQKARGGKPHQLSIETRALMMLEYWREYRTYFHIGGSYGVSESTAFRTIRWCEDTLIKSGAFTLPGKKALLKSDMTFEVVLIDATETPVERPQKSSVPATPARKSAAPSRHK
jgi:Helix-turn-helix of DDE superfamily endonuclease